MTPGIIGKKIGMTQVFNAEGQVVPVTLVKAGPCVVTQRKTPATDGYDAIQLGFVEFAKKTSITKPAAGHLKKSGAEGVKFQREFKLEPGNGDYKVGGFAGVVKRHHFGGGEGSHGSMFHRAPGSIGGSSFPSRVFPGTRMGGRMGGGRVTVKNLEVVQVDAEDNILMVKGAIPGPNGSYVLLRRVK
jgi:large subunit ribosomal protein L3